MTLYSRHTLGDLSIQASPVGNGVGRTERQSEGTTELAGLIEAGAGQGQGDTLPQPASSISLLDSPVYLETVDNVSEEEKHERNARIDKVMDKLPAKAWLEHNCAEGRGFFVWGECGHGHAVAKELVCAKEWCPDCGKDDSHAHARRYARWVPYITQMRSMGYFVFTLPAELESEYRTKAKLREWGHDVQEMLKGFGFARGLRRFHWFGDVSTRWRPHLNVMVDGSFIDDAKLDAIKAAYASLLGVSMADVAYGYRSAPGKMWHTLTYVTRSTFRNYEWDEEMASEIHGFRNMVVWGRGLWNGPAVWDKEELHGKERAQANALDLEAMHAIEKGKCPVCGDHLEWHEALPKRLLDLVEKTAYGGGFWRLKDIPPDPGIPYELGTVLYQLEYLESVEPTHARKSIADLVEAHRLFVGRRSEEAFIKRMELEAWSSADVSEWELKAKYAVPFFASEGMRLSPGGAGAA